MSQVKGEVIRQRQDRKCPWAAILISKISVADNRLGISSQCFNYPQQVRSAFPVQLYIGQWASPIVTHREITDVLLRHVTGPEEQM